VITTLLLLLAVTGAPAPAPALLQANVARELSCIARNTADGKERRCQVDIPAGTKVKPCAAADKVAMRCTLDKKARYVAWTVSTDGAACRIAKKSTKWGKRIVVKVGKKTKPGAGTCELRVVVQ
jgi:hypothetical protein